MTNRLEGERSAYLRSAARQPVGWRPWGDDAFAAARAEDKPILLDVGAVWCHWCHVMDRESYEDEATAARIDALFVPVKVDRDERPDVDARYQKAIQAMTGQGGWPLTAFLLPDGRPFYGGTYFPPVDAQGRPGFPRVLQAVADAYRSRRAELLANADALAAHLREETAPAVPPAPPEGWDDAIARAAGAMRDAFDAEHGGFGSAPKFPHPAAVDLLLARAAEAGDAAAGDVARFTLERMRAGGVYDQLGGGFHRYSVDASWSVPHYEKMLYDNAGLLRNYARAAALRRGADGSADASIGEDEATADDVARFLRDVLQQPGGGFGGSQDADTSLDDDGDSFTWTLDELRAALDDEGLARLMAAHYGLAGATGRRPLRVAADAHALAAAFRLPLDRTQALLERGKRELQAARAKRAVPFVDPTRYTAWNAMAIQALLEHGGRHARREADEMALRALDALLAGAWDARRGWARAVGGATFGLLDDNAQALDALLEAHYATGEGRFLDVARATADLLLSSFRHPAGGGFADRAPDLAPREAAAPLAAPERPLQDAPTASPNGVACRALLRLAEASGERRYRDEATSTLRALVPEASRLGVFGGAVLLAAHEATRPRPRIVVKGPEAAFRAAARRAAPPGSTFARADDPGVPEEARLFPGEGAMVCVGTRCLPPARTPAELEARLRGG